MTRTTIATDDFNRASLGSDYAQINAGLGGNVQVNSSIRVNGQFSTQPVEDKATARRVTETFSDDQFASLQLVNINDDIGSAEKVGVCVRCGSATDGSKSMYTAYVTSGPAGNKTITLDKWVSGTRTALHSASVAFTNNDYIELEVLGTTLTVCKNGVALGGSFTTTDASLSTGRPGIVCGATGTFGDNATFGDVTVAAPVLSDPVGTATGKDAATAGATTDTASGTLYAVASSSATQPTGAQIEAGNDHTGSAADSSGSLAISSTGAKTIALTSITPDAARYMHLVHKDGSSYSNVVTSSSFTCPTLALTGSLSAQGGTEGSALSWAGSNPSALVTGNGIGTRTWTIQSAGGSGLSSINGSTGVVSGTLPAAGVYTVTLRVTDQSTAGSEIPQTEDISFTLTVTGGLTGAVTLDAVVPAGTLAPQPGVIQTPPLKNNTGTILASIGSWTVNVYHPTTGALVVQKTSLTTSAGGVLTITDALMIPGVSYAYEPVHATYGRRLPTAAATA